MRLIHVSIVAAAAALAVVAGARPAFAEPGNDANNSQVAGTPTTEGDVTTTINLAGGGKVASTIHITVPMSARLKALEIANAISRDTSCTASVGATGSTVTVTSARGKPDISSVTIDAGATKEGDTGTGKDPQKSGTAMYLFSGTVGTPGTVTVGIGGTEFEFDVSTYGSLGGLRLSVATTLSANGFAAQVGADGTVYANVPAGVDGVYLCVDCETMTADCEGYKPEEP